MSSTTNPTPALPLTFTNATIYLHSSFGISQTDCRTITVSIRSYAQYKSAIALTYIPKGKRSAKNMMLTYDPYLVIVPTAQAIAPQSALVSATSDGQVERSTSRYSSCDPRWRTDFDAALTAANVPILADFRGFNTTAR